MGVDVVLTPAELLMATSVGALRQSESSLVGRADNHGFEGDGLSLHLLGAAGELAVGRVLGRYWGGDVGSFKRADIGTDIQVRTRSRDHYDLIIRPDDDPNSVFVLVTGSLSRLTVHGWILGRDGQKPEWLKEYAGRPAAWFVPQSALNPLGVREAA